MSQIAAKRRRRQAKNGFKHLCEQERPKYNKRDARTSAQRLQAQIEKQKLMQQRKGMKAKS